MITEKIFTRTSLKQAYSVAVLCVCTSIIVFQATAQSNYVGLPSLVWPKLYDIQYEKANDNLGEFQKPLFSQAAKSLEGKVITLPGYIIPYGMDVKGTKFILSSLPANACFFCGVGGPESVIEVKLKTSISFTEKPVEVRGVLRLNDKNPDQMIYRLESAEFLGEVDF